MEKNKKKSGVIIEFKTNKNNSNIPSNEYNGAVKQITNEKDYEKDFNIDDKILINMSHELKTPLNVIYGASQLIDIQLNNDIDKLDKEKLLLYNKSIKNNCFRLTKYIGSILELASLEAGQCYLNLSEINIVKTLNFIVEEITYKLKDKNFSIALSTSLKEKNVVVDARLFHKAILNLLSNAIKFSKQDENKNIIIKLINNKNYYEIIVEDNGIGIEKENLNNIFKRFGQVDKSISRNVEGSGIGLSLTKEIVRRHGGEIFVNSTINIGSSFTIRMPKDINLLNEKSEFTDDNLVNYEELLEMINIEFSDIY